MRVVYYISKSLQIIKEQGLPVFFAKVKAKLTKKKVTSDESCYSYEKWLKIIEPSSSTLRWMNKMSSQFAYAPSIIICLRIESLDKNDLKNSISSIFQQCYPHWNLFIFSHINLHIDLSQFKTEDIAKIKIFHIKHYDEINRVLFNAKGDLICFIDSGDIIKPSALFEVVEQLNLDSNIDVIYADHDLISSEGARRERPHFKPDWSRDLFLSTDYINGCFFIKRELFERMGGLRFEVKPAEIYDLLVRITENNPKIFHISSILFSKKQKDKVYQKTFENVRKMVVEDSLKRSGIEAEVMYVTENILRIKRKIKGSPLVSIIIPALSKNSKILKKCIISIIRNTSYKNYEIILITDTPKKLNNLKNTFSSLLHRINVSYFQFKEHFLNRPRINNFGAKMAKGEYFLFLNDDVEIITPGWIESLLEHAQRFEVGVVGGKLFFPNRKIYHAGIFLVDHGDGFLHFLQGAVDERENVFLHSVRDCSAITGACLMVRRSIFEILGGFDEEFKVTHYDVDFCIRAQKKGYSVIWTPFSCLYKHMSKTLSKRRGMNNDKKLFWNRWRYELCSGDPFYNRNLTLDQTDCSLNSRSIIIQHHQPELIKPKEIKKILVVKLDHIGDVILSLPAIKLLRSKFPHAKITVLCATWVKPIIEQLSKVDEVLTFDFFYERSEMLPHELTKVEKDRLYQWLSTFDFDLAIDLRRHSETREFLKLSGARYTVGYATGIDDSWMSFCISQTDKIRDVPTMKEKMHITAQLCQLVKSIPTQEEEISTLYPLIKPVPKTIIDKFFFLKEKPLLIGIHPTAGTPSRQWPLSHFVRLIELILEQTPATIVIFGGKGDRGYVKEIIKQIQIKEEDNNRVHSLVGQITLEEFMEIVQVCHLFIGNISGPAHIASILGVPTLTIFSGMVSPHEWSPLGEKTLCISLNVPCAPCYFVARKDQCPYNLKCLTYLWPEKVWEVAKRLLILTSKFY